MWKIGGQYYDMICYDIHEKTMNFGESYEVIEGINLTWKTKYSDMSGLF